MGSLRPILIAGQWRASHATESFCATNPRTRQALDDRYPVSGWRDIEAALASADDAARALRDLPGQRIAEFLEAHAAAIESRAEELVAAAHQETALPASPRLRDIELPRTTSQLRQAAVAAQHGSWLRPTIDTKANIRSCLAPIGPVFVIGPSNFPFAFNAISGGDFAAALAAGNPVIAKAHPLHPTTSRLLAEAAHQAATAVDLPAGAVQMLYHVSPGDGLRLLSDSRIAAVAFTGSRASGMKLKSAADAAGKLFFAEMSSINPVVILPQAIRERADTIAQELVGSMLMGSGQFCTNPGLVLLLHSVETEAFIEAAGARLASAPAGTLFSEAGAAALSGSIDTLQKAGATLLTGGTVGDPACGFCVQNTLLHTTAGRFLENPRIFQTECFGTASLAVVARSPEELIAVIETLEGSLAASVYSASPADDRTYAAVDRALRPRVGRLLNDKMPTGVAVSPAMHHGGPFPATTQPHFTAVGVPASLWRFTQLQCWDNVREDRLPPCLRNRNPGQVWRCIDGQWTQADVSP
jgi:NADP-dependent aldehyde dehydrogenase